MSKGHASITARNSPSASAISRVCGNRAGWRRAAGPLDGHLRDGSGDAEDRGRRRCEDGTADSGQGEETSLTDRSGTARPVAFGARDRSGQVLQPDPRCGGPMFALIGVRSVPGLRTVTGGASSGGRDGSQFKRTEPSSKPLPFVAFASGLDDCQFKRGAATAANSI